MRLLPTLPFTVRGEANELRDTGVYFPIAPSPSACTHPIRMIPEFFKSPSPIIWLECAHTINRPLVNSTE